MARLRRIATRSWLRPARPIGTDRFGGGRRPHCIQGVLRRHERSDWTLAGALGARTGYRAARHRLVLSAAIVPAPPASYSNNNLIRNSPPACAYRVIPRLGFRGIHLPCPTCTEACTDLQNAIAKSE